MDNKFFKKVTAGALALSFIGYSAPVFAFTKDETVYSKHDVYGKSYNTLVSTHLINSGEENLINDLSDLVNIKNVNGDEEFSQDGNSLVWKADGADIYYQGESSKELPIECKVSYTLDGRNIEAKDLAGKSRKS